MIPFPTLMSEAVDFYARTACPCAFPRFRQYSVIDCVDYAASFSFAETEALIHYARPSFDIPEPGPGRDNAHARWTCKTCRSTWDFGWDDFSIHVSRSYLKPVEILAGQVGADPITPIPFVAGPEGHRFPPRELFQPVETEAFLAYLTALRG